MKLCGTDLYWRRSKKEGTSRRQRVFHRGDQHCLGELESLGQVRGSSPGSVCLQSPYSRGHGAHCTGVNQAHFSVLSPTRGRNKKGEWIGSEIERKNVN